MTVTVGMQGAGFMGAGVGAALRSGGARVVTAVEGRSARTRGLVAKAGIEALPTVDDVVRAADVVLSIVPPASAREAAEVVAAACARTGATPLYADLNAVSPVTVAGIAEVLAAAGLDLVDGSISGPPPDVAKHPVRVYLSGPNAAEVAGLPWTNVDARVVSAEIGAASAVKMCTASIYKGLGALMANALSTAASHGVAEHVIADVGGAYEDPVRKVALSATKAHRFVGEMHEIAATQRAAGLSPALFEAVAEVWAAVATTELAHGDAENVPRDLDAAEVLAKLRTGRLGA